MAHPALLALVTTATVSGGATPMALAPGSSVTFEAFQSLGTTKGRFHRFDGDFSIDLDDVAKSSVTVRIDAASIDTDNGSRDEHLRSDDFFDVEKHPKVVFRSTSIAAEAKDRVQVKGELQVKGKAVPVAFDMQLDRRDGGGVRARGRMQISRKRLGIDYEAPFYLPSVKDQVNLAFDVRLTPAR